MCGLYSMTDATHFSGTVLTYGIVFLSTNEPKPSRKFCVMFLILSAVNIALTIMKSQHAAFGRKKNYKNMSPLDILHTSF